MASFPLRPATIDDLYRVEGKAELNGGRIVHYMATGRRPNRVAFRIARGLDPIAECIHVYRASSPVTPQTYRRGDIAEAEPAVPGWRVDVAWLFS